jgi:hypothetical protein
MKNLAFVFILLFGTSAFSQELKPANFVLDPSKNYVYLKFDHIGPVKLNPDSKEENYLWLKVVNNCRIPIVFRAQGPPPGYPGVSLENEVVEQEPLMLFSYSPRELKDSKRQEKLRRENLKHKPRGDSFEVSGVAKVQPGEELLFSVPLNYVDEDWYLRIKFALDLNNSSEALGPFTYLPFMKWDIPKNERLSDTNPPVLKH